ncbi:MAG: peptide ABC transporter permease, partial [Pseudomonadales bacterium]|nr:peptide ABC transporter permease [Pseudomonadales bacterium]
MYADQWETDISMANYFLRRLLLIIPTFLGITLLVFTITRFVPGGPIERMITQAQLAGENNQMQVRSDGVGSSTLSEEQIAELKAFYGFDKPLVESYFIWLGKVMVFDLGVSSRYNEPVWDIIVERFPISIFYGVTTLVLTYAICIPL